VFFILSVYDLVYSISPQQVIDLLLL